MITDITTGAGVTMDLVHHKIHSEDYYSGADTCTIGAATTMYYVLRTAKTTQEGLSNVKFSIGATGSVAAALFETASVSTATGESSIVFRNNNRAAASASTTAVRFSRALTANVTSLTTFLDVSGASASLVGMLPSNIAAEWILNSGTTYALQVMNTNAALTTNVSVACYFYQQSPS